MKFGSTLALLAIIGFVTSFAGAEEKAKVVKKDVLKAAKCPLSGKDINKEKFVTYKDSKLYMCCGNCVKGFAAAAKAKPAIVAKANHQLFVTEQAEQSKCCLNGKGKINKEAKTKLAGVEVYTCCKNCLGKVKKMEEKEAVSLVFGKNFEKAFVVKAEEAKKKKAAEKKTAA